MIYGVDVHPDYQRGLHWPTLYAQGYRFGAIKHTQGTGYSHNLTDEWVRDCRAAGLLAGAYHWLDASDGTRQARWFWKRVLECGGPKGMLVMLDVEDTASPPSKATVSAWAAEWTRLSGGHPFSIYTGGWWWKPHMGTFGSNITPHLWHSSYLDADVDSIPDDPATFASRIPASWWTPGYGGWKKATFLQFSSRGDAGRLSNNVDLNATKLTMDQLRALAGLGAAGAPGDTGGGIVGIPADAPINPQEEDHDMPLILVRLVSLTGPDRDQIWQCGGGRMRRVSTRSVAGTKDPQRVLDGEIVGDGPISNNQVHGDKYLGSLANDGKVYQSRLKDGYTEAEYRAFWGAEDTPAAAPMFDEEQADRLGRKLADVINTAVGSLLAGATVDVRGKLELHTPTDS